MEIERADAIYRVIQADFYDAKQNLYHETSAGKQGLDENKYSYVWPLSAVYQAYCEKYRTDGKKDAQLLSRVRASVDQYEDAGTPPAPGYDSYVYEMGGGQRYYDDNEWLGLADCDLYEATGDGAYLQKAQEIYRFVLTGRDSALGDGIYWREGDVSSKNTCSNAPAVALALKLYLVTGKSRSAYLTDAKALYAWVNSHLRAPDGLYWDNIKTGDSTVDQTEWTYNTGMMIDANALFYKATGDGQYLSEARKIAAASLRVFAPSGSFPGDLWFNAVLLRGYRDLYEQDRDPAYMNAFEKYADALWATRDKNGCFGRKSPAELKDQAAMLEIYEVLAQYNKK